MAAVRDYAYAVPTSDGPVELEVAFWRYDIPGEGEQLCAAANKVLDGENFRLRPPPDPETAMAPLALDFDPWHEVDIPDARSAGDRFQRLPFGWYLVVEVATGVPAVMCPQQFGAFFPMEDE